MDFIDVINSIHEVNPKGMLNAAIVSLIFLAYEASKRHSPIGIAITAVLKRRLDLFRTQLATGARIHIIDIGIDPTQATKEQKM